MVPGETARPWIGKEKSHRSWVLLDLIVRVIVDHTMEWVDVVAIGEEIIGVIVHVGH